MDNSSYLDPESIINQSDSAIRSMREQNGKLSISDSSIEAFVNDLEIKSRSFDELKAHMEDYMTISKAICYANAIDIVDYEILKEAVGSEVLDGSVILAQEQEAENSRINHEENSQYYRNQSSENDNPIFKFFYTAQANLYSILATIDNNIYSQWQAKEKKYDEIEAATSDLFSESGSARALIDAGLAEIEAGFKTGSYSSNRDAKWRKELPPVIRKMNTDIKNKLQRGK